MVAPRRAPLLRTLARLGLGALAELAALAPPLAGDALATRPPVRWAVLGFFRGAPRLAPGEWARAGEAYELACRELVRAATWNAVARALDGPMGERLLVKLVDRVLAALPERPGTFALVECIVAELRDEPELLPLVDRVVHHLVRNTEVETLVHAQSTSLVDNAVDELRAHTVRADQALERVVSRLRGAKGHR